MYDVVLRVGVERWFFYCPKLDYVGDETRGKLGLGIGDVRVNYE